jgi:MFS family permease
MAKRYGLEQGQEVGRELRGPNVLTERVLVPMAQAGLAGAGAGVAVLAVWVALVGNWHGWRLALFVGVLCGAGLLVWRFVWEVRLPVLSWLESVTGEDLDGNGAVGSTGRVQFTEAGLDRRARQALRLASEGQSISRRALVPRMMRRGEWEAMGRRLVARGVCKRAGDGSLLLGCGSFAEAWEKYTAPRTSTGFWVDEEDGLVSKD